MASLTALILLVCHTVLTSLDGHAPSPPDAAPSPSVAATPSADGPSARGELGSDSAAEEDAEDSKDGPEVPADSRSTAGPAVTESPAQKKNRGEKGEFTRPGLLSLLGAVEVVPLRPNVPGYERSCSPGDGCVFGTAWNDATSAPSGRNGCDTRNDVLRRDLHNVVIDSGTNGCVVRRGTLDDPYTGRTIQFERGWGSSLAVQVDHLIPLAAAWDLGAASWPRARREAFANDVEHELLAVDGPTNEEKSDDTPSDWLPPHRAFRCEYAVRYVLASTHWKLPLTQADHSAITRVAEEDCAN